MGTTTFQEMKQRKYRAMLIVKMHNIFSSVLYNINVTREIASPTVRAEAFREAQRLVKEKTP